MAVFWLYKVKNPFAPRLLLLFSSSSSVLKKSSILVQLYCFSRKKLLSLENRNLLWYEDVFYGFFISLSTDMSPDSREKSYFDTIFPTPHERGRGRLWVLEADQTPVPLVEMLSKPICIINSAEKAKKYLFTPAVFIYLYIEFLCWKWIHVYIFLYAIQKVQLSCY